MNCIVIEITGPKQLANSETMAFIPFYGTQESCLSQWASKYPWMDGTTAFYQASVGTLFVPAEYLSEKAVKK